MSSDTKPKEDKNSKPKDGNKEIMRQHLVLPIVLIVIAVLMILVSGIFTSITYFQFNKLKILEKVSKNTSNFLLGTMIVIWVGFVISLILLGLTYGAYRMVDDNATSQEGIRKNNNSTTAIWIAVFVVATLVLITAIIDLILTVIFKPVSSVLFTNMLIATITSIGGFVFIVIGSIFYAVTTGEKKEYFKTLISKSEEKKTS